MRALIAGLLVVAMLAACVAPAWADRNHHREDHKASDLEKGIAIAGLLYLLSRDHGSKPCQQPQAMEPVAAAPEPLQRAANRISGLIIKEANGRTNVRMVAEGVLSEAGWVVINEKARRAAEEENRRNGGANDIVPAKWFGYVNADFSQASDYEYRQCHSGRGYSNSSGRGSRGIKCVVQIEIADGGNFSFHGQGIGYSWSRYDWFRWDSRRWGESQRSCEPADEDLALLASVVSASNQIIQQYAAAGVPAQN